MKILFPVEVFFPSQAGGPANSVYWLTKHLRKRGILPVVVASDKGLAPDHVRGRWLERDAGRVIFFHTPRTNFPVMQTLSALRQVSDADIVHLSSVFYPSAFIVAFAAGLLGKTIVCSPRGELDPQALKYSGGRKRPILWVLQKLLARQLVFHSTCSQETKYIRDVFGDNARVMQVENYMDIPHEVKCSQGRYLLFIGRLNPKKGIDNLLRAIAMNERFMKSDLKLKLAGRNSHDHEPVLRSLVSELGLHEKVEFLGQIEGEEKQKLLAGALWTVMPSHTENFGIVVLESLAQNTPVIASKGSPWESLEEENVGFWVGTSPERLSAAIDRALDIQKEEYLSMRSRSRKFVETRYSMEANVDKWIDLYRSLSPNESSQA
jgi:glycosyltransferase involved in cell wall biosynthesis